MTDRRKSRPRPTSRRSIVPSYMSVLAEGASRRSVLKGLFATTALAAGGSLAAKVAPAFAAPSSLTFAELDRVTDAVDHWPAGYRRQILLRWGDPLFADAPAFDPATLDGAAAARQFGTNNDFTAFLPLPQGSASSDHGLLVVSHEYATPFLMFDGVTDEDWRDKLSDAQIAAVAASTGLSIVEVKRDGAEWSVVLDSPHNRRIHLETPIALSGPAAGDDRLKTKADPEGRLVLGTISNCSGGITPWGTILSGEEGGMDVFAGDFGTLPERELVERQG